ncbi:hypothetical protein [Candidatus Amarolinea dominans]|uniref:hypothetical protein n=1 Tax=Candidatus Amarolinea dominans TaxID=3140696 RepID=UPI001DB353AA|nr:hypothetical protein [Anaerolineae bacterium]
MQQPWRLVTRGASLGALTGVVLASIYAALAVPALAFWLLLTNSNNGRLLDALVGVTLLSLCAGPFAFVLGIARPRSWAWWAARCWARFSSRCTITSTTWVVRPLASSLGLLVAAIALLTLNEGLIDPAKPGFAGYYLFFFWLVGPSLLVIVGFAWVGWRLGLGTSRQPLTKPLREN